ILTWPAFIALPAFPGTTATVMSRGVSCSLVGRRVGGLGFPARTPMRPPVLRQEGLVMRLVLAAQFFPPDIGGEERHVFNLANILADRGHDVVVATQRISGSLDDEVLPSG